MNYDQATEEIMERKPEEGNEIIEDQGQISSGNILQNIFSNIKYLYSLDDLLREYELNSTGFFRNLLRANYFVRNFVYLGQNELRSIVKRKTKEDRAQPSDLKSIAFQYVSQAMFTITYGNMLRIFSIQDKSNFSKFFLREDKEFAFEVKDSVNAIATHPYLPFTFALAFEKDVKIFEYEGDTSDFLTKQKRNPTNVYLKEEIKFGKFSTKPSGTINVECTALEYSPDGKYLAMIHRYSNTIKVLSLDTGKIKDIKIRGNSFNKLKWSSSGSHLAVFSKMSNRLIVLYAGTWEYTTIPVFSPISSMEWNRDGSSLYTFLKAKDQRHPHQIIEFVDHEADKITTGRQKNLVYFVPKAPFVLELENEELLKFTFFRKDNHIEYCYLTDNGNEECFYINGQLIPDMFNSHEPSKSLFVAKYKGESNADNTSEMIFKNTFGTSDMVEDSSSSLAELTLSIHNHLNSIKNYKKNLAKRFEDIDVSSKKVGKIEEEGTMETKYLEMKTKYDELEESYHKQIKDTVSVMKESKLTSDKKNFNFEDEISKKNAKIEELMQQSLKHQEQIASLEARNNRLETMNETLVNQLKDKTIELASHSANAEVNLEKKKKELLVMKTEFQKVLDTIGSLEENVKTLKEAKKKDSESIDQLTKSFQELQNENFNLLVENKKLKNQITDMSNQNESLNRWFMERKEKSNQFINEIATHNTTIQHLSQTQNDIDTVVGPLKVLNSKLLKEKEDLLEENRKLKLKAGKESSKMAIEEPKPESAEGEEKMVTAEFYKDLFEKIASKESQVIQNINLTKERDREIIAKLKQKIVELEEELESTRNSKKRVRKNIDTDPEDSIKKPAPRPEPKVLKLPEKKNEDIKEPKAEEKDPLKFLEENGLSGEKDERLKINRKPKTVTTEKKDAKPLGLFNTLTICAGCTMIVKKGDKGEPCQKCQSVMHEKCVKVLDDKNLCKACFKKAENEKAAKESVTKQPVE